jgi:hypothetical protein
LEKEMATHSSVLAWRIPGTEEPGGLLAGFLTLLLLLKSVTRILQSYYLKIERKRRFKPFAFLPESLILKLPYLIEEPFHTGYIRQNFQLKMGKKGY